MSQRGKYVPPSLDDPCPTIATQGRLALASVAFLSKQFSGAPEDKNISVDAPAGTVTCVDHHALVSVNFIANEYSGGGQLSSIEQPNPAVLTRPKQALISCNKFLMNPQYNSPGGSVDSPSFTLIARMDKMPPYLVTTESGDIAIEVYDTDSQMTVKIKEFMAMYQIIDIKMRMLKIPELKLIMGFPEDYVLIGTQADQKKFIGNAVEVTISRAWCEALCQELDRNRTSVIKYLQEKEAA